MLTPIVKDPVFVTVGQALHVAFLMEVLPPTQKGPTQIFIEDMMRRRFNLDQLSATERRLNTSGLSPLELRGQCAIIRACVQDHLPAPERAAVWSRYGHHRTKVEGVRGLVAYLGSMCPMQHREAQLALTWAIYTPRAVTPDRHGRSRDWSLRDISKRYDVPRSTLGETRQLIKQHGQRLESVGEDRLGELFDRTGLVGELVEA